MGGGGWGSILNKRRFVRFPASSNCIQGACFLCRLTPIAAMRPLMTCDVTSGDLGLMRARAANWCSVHAPCLPWVMTSLAFFFFFFFFLTVWESRNRVRGASLRTPHPTQKAMTVTLGTTDLPVRSFGRLLNTEQGVCCDCYGALAGLIS